MNVNTSASIQTVITTTKIDPRGYPGTGERENTSNRLFLTRRQTTAHLWYFKSYGQNASNESIARRRSVAGSATDNRPFDYEPQVYYECMRTGDTTKQSMMCYNNIAWRRTPTRAQLGKSTITSIVVFTSFIPDTIEWNGKVDVVFID